MLPRYGQCHGMNSWHCALPAALSERACFARNDRRLDEALEIHKHPNVLFCVDGFVIRTLEILLHPGLMQDAR